eukprot:297617-Hanusia_phi.AAC.2
MRAALKDTVQFELPGVRRAFSERRPGSSALETTVSDEAAAGFRPSPGPDRRSDGPTGCESVFRVTSHRESDGQPLSAAAQFSARRLRTPCQAGNQDLAPSLSRSKPPGPGPEVESSDDPISAACRAVA